MTKPDEPEPTGHEAHLAAWQIERDTLLEPWHKPVAKTRSRLPFWLNENARCIDAWKPINRPKS
jgi:hypothetical protein